MIFKKKFLKNQKIFKKFKSNVFQKNRIFAVSVYIML